MNNNLKLVINNIKNKKLEEKHFFEREEFSKGTLHLAKVISESDAYSVIGGGETLTAFNQSNLLDKVGYASTAGGAFLEYIEKGSLPSLDALKEKI